MHRDDWNFSQFAKPVGEEGRVLLEDMNVHHRQLSGWGLSNLPKTACKDILDIGCGGGMLISLLAKKYHSAKINGIDISDESVKLASEVNAGLIEEGRCIIREGSVSELPFADGSFDLVTAFETYFFWPDFRNDIVEACRVVREGGIIAILSETYPHPDFNERNAEYVKLYGLKLLDNQTLAAIVGEQGFEVETYEVEENNWVIFVGKRITSS